MPPISIILLSFNSERSIGRTLQSLSSLSGDIHAVDSYSTDRTLEILAAYGVKVVQRPFKNYSDQRNWAINNIPAKHEWQFHVDADEELEPKLRDAIAQLDFAATPHDGFIMGRKLVFMGKVLRFGGIAKTWHYRLFRKGAGRCEDRLYDQHFVASGNTGRIDAFMLDHQEASLSSWTASHNRWSDAEAEEIMRRPEPQQNVVQAKAGGNVLERKRYLKGRYYGLPLFFRAIAYFLYRYFIRLGMLDGRRGLIYHFLQGLWFRFLVDAKIYEARHGRRDEQPQAEGRSGGPMSSVSARAGESA